VRRHRAHHRSLLRTPRPSSTLIWIGVGAVAAVAALALGRQAATDRPEPLAVGAAAPRFTLLSTTGERVAFAPPVARPLVLAFVGTGCSHCVRTAPELVALARRGTTVLAIDAAAGSAEERTTFARDELAGAVPFLADPGGRVSERYRASATPTVYVLRPDGRIAAAWVGEVSPQRFEAALTAARG
jgi:peroxiredoxin